MANSGISPNPLRFYVYEVIVNGVVRYIGKGTGPRARKHALVARKINEQRATGAKIRTSDFYNNLAKSLRDDAIVEFRIVEDGLSSEAAFNREAQRIAGHSGSVLWNETPGGDGFRIDDLADPEKYRKKLLAGVRKSWKNPDRYRVASEAAKRRWEDQQARQIQGVAVQAAWADEKLRVAHGEKLKARFESEDDFKARQRSVAESRWSRPGEREKMSMFAKEMQRQRSAKRNANAMNSILGFGS